MPSNNLHGCLAPIKNNGSMFSIDIAIIGAGPAGLMAAERLAAAGQSVHVFDAMPSVGRKFLLAGKGGLNLTHAEPMPQFVARYGQHAEQVAPWLQAFGAAEIRQWAQGLGVDTFVGTSGRVFPAEMKAAPLLRAWLHRLRHGLAAPVTLHMRHRWLGWAAGQNPLQLCFASPTGQVQVQAQAVVLALGGGSWARLGPDGAWVPWLQAQGVDVAPLAPSNCGFDAAGRCGLGWTPHLATQYAGAPLKNVALTWLDHAGQLVTRQGECVLTNTGLEGSLIYIASSAVRDQIVQQGSSTVWLNLLPGLASGRVAKEVAHPRGSRSLSSHLKSRLHLDGVKTALLYELLPREMMNDASQLAQAIQHLPVVLKAPRPLDEAISSAGGVRFEMLTQDLMLKPCPGVFCAGEMLDWEAPTGGYLLTACMASGVQAAQGVLRWMGRS